MGFRLRQGRGHLLQRCAAGADRPCAGVAATRDSVLDFCRCGLHRTVGRGRVERVGVNQFRPPTARSRRPLHGAVVEGAVDPPAPGADDGTGGEPGFVPMALNIGTEVQRPLATAMIGGIVSSTLLTRCRRYITRCIATTSVAPMGGPEVPSCTKSSDPENASRRIFQVAGRCTRCGAAVERPHGFGKRPWRPALPQSSIEPLGGHLQLLAPAQCLLQMLVQVPATLRRDGISFASGSSRLCSR